MLIVLSFVAIALMRIVQKICSKRVSNSVKSGALFFRYGAFYQFVAALFSLITLAFVGFYGFNVPTVLCALAAALLFAVDLYTGIEVLKGCSIAIATMFSLGGLIISCVLSIFMFDEPMSVFQAVGLALFFVGAYLLTPSKSKEKKKIGLKTYILLFVSFLVNGFVMIVQKYFSQKVVGGNVATFSFLTFVLNALILLFCAVASTVKQKNGEKAGAAASIENAENEAVEGEAAISQDVEKCAAVVERKKEEERPVLFGLTKTHLICGALLAFAVFVINLLVTELGKTVPSVILFPISSAISIGLSVIVGWVVYKEKLTVRNFVGVRGAFGDRRDRDADPRDGGELVLKKVKDEIRND